MGVVLGADRRVADPIAVLPRHLVAPGLKLGPGPFEPVIRVPQLAAGQSGVQDLVREGSYEKALSHMATLRPIVDRFFDDVMVMVDDEALRNNRLLLLKQLRDLFLEVADIAKL